MLKAICAGFKETADPPICLSGGWCACFIFQSILMSVS